jgi:hypothetical protein
MKNLLYNDRLLAVEVGGGLNDPGALLFAISLSGEKDRAGG